MARIEVGNPFDNQIPTVEGTAQTVDTYVRSIADTAKYDTLIRSLQSLTGKANSVLSQEEQRAAEREFKEGQELYNTTRLNMGDAVRQGIVPEGASPFIRKGYRASLMGTLSTRYATELENALNSQKLYTTGDPKKIEQFIAKFQSDFMNSNGLSDFNPSEVAQYFGNDANNANERFRGAWQSKHVAWQAEQAYAAMERQVASVTANLFHAGMTPEELSSSKEQLKTWVEGLAGNASINGMDNKRVTATILQGVAIASQMTGDGDILDVFLNTKFGTAAVASSLDNQAKILSIRSSINAINAANAVANEKAYDAAMENLRGQTSAAVIGGILDGTATPESIKAATDALIATGDEKNIDQAWQLNGYYESTLGADGRNKTVESELFVNAQMARASTEAEAMAVLTAAGEANILDSGEATRLLESWRSDAAKETGTGVNFYTGTTPEGAGMAAIKSIMTNNESSFSDTSGADVVAAQREYRVKVTEAVGMFFQTTGRQPTSFEMDSIVQEQIAKIQTTLTGTEAYSGAVVPSVNFSATSVPEF